MKKLDNFTYKPIGKCIYCGITKNLRDEHILPFGLSGTAVLPDSTCQKCATITGNIEQKVLRGFMWLVRVHRDLESRTRHKEAPKSCFLIITKNGQEQQIEVPLEKYPILLNFPIFEPPAYLYPNEYKKGILLSGIATVSFGQRPEEVAKSLSSEKTGIPQDQEPVAFARMIAKIAYAFAAAERKLDLIFGVPLVLPAILCKKDDIGRWVGTLTEPIQKYEGILHRILIYEDQEKKLLIGEVHLFSDSQTPKYGVILGKLCE